MTWLIKRGRYEYVFAGSVRAVEWTDDQGLAHRFRDRNHAAHVLGNMPADRDEVRIVRLVRKDGASCPF